MIDIASALYGGLLAVLLTVTVIVVLYLAIRQEIQEPGSKRPIPGRVPGPSMPPNKLPDVRAKLPSQRVEKF